MLMDGVHFVLGDCGGARAGHKALGVNLSDLAAMAAIPMAAFVSLALRSSMAVPWPAAIRTCGMGRRSSTSRSSALLGRAAR
jgi:thiamine-monophosphate kinase